MFLRMIENIAASNNIVSQVPTNRWRLYFYPTGGTAEAVVSGNVVSTDAYNTSGVKGIDSGMSSADIHGNHIAD